MRLHLWKTDAPWTFYYSGSEKPRWVVDEEQSKDYYGRYTGVLYIIAKGKNPANFFNDLWAHHANDHFHH